MCLDYYKCFRIGNWERNYDLMNDGMLWYVGKHTEDVGTFNVKNINGTKQIEIYKVV